MIRPGFFKDAKNADQLGETARTFLMAAQRGDIVVMAAVGISNPEFDFGVKDHEGHNGADLAKEGGHQPALKFLQEKGVTPTQP